MKQHKSLKTVFQWSYFTAAIKDNHGLIYVDLENLQDVLG